MTRPPANKNNVWCQQWHLRAAHGIREFPSGKRQCRTCYRQRLAIHCARVKAQVRERGLAGNRWLWEDNNYEYRYMRETLGMSPRDIADKTGTSWPSFQRALWRHVGGVTEW